ncbi:MAG: tol-pal system protein YbgF [Nitrospirota bacterium]|nr:tol-pal system protein YbgF [Nitrospirota bacterium]
MSDLDMKALPLTWCRILISLSLGSATAHAQLPEIEREIADFDRQIHLNRELAQLKEKNRGPLDDEINKNQAAIAELERRLSPLTIGLEGLKLSSQKSRNLLDTAVSNPELVDSQKLEALHKDYRAALVSQSQKENETTLLSKELDGYRKKADDLKRQKKALDLEIEILNRGVRSLALKKPVILEAEGECVMHDDITPKACKEQAVLRAKQSAIETGGTSLVRSLTEVSMSDIVRDEISVKTLAKIRHIDMLQPPQLVAQGELGKYVTKIRAVVQSQLPEIQATEHKPVSEAQTIAPSPIPQPWTVPPIGPLIHIVKPGETLYRVARKYGVTVSQLKQWNHMPDDIFEVGQKLIVGPLPTLKGIDLHAWESTGSQMPGVPTNTPTSTFNLAYNDYLNGKYDLAVVGFQRFVKDFPGTSLTPNAYYWLGESYYQQKDYVGAMRSFEYFSTEYPGNEKAPAAFFKSGLAAGITGDLATAKKYLNRVIEEFPMSDEAKLAKNRLADIR